MCHESRRSERTKKRVVWLGQVLSSITSVQYAPAYSLIVEQAYPQYPLIISSRNAGTGLENPHFFRSSRHDGLIVRLASSKNKWPSGFKPRIYGIMTGVNRQKETGCVELTIGDEMNIGGILIHGANAPDIATARHEFLERLSNLGINQHLDVTAEDGGQSTRFRLRAELRNDWAPDYDTLQLRSRSGLDPKMNSASLEHEIILAMLLGPVTFEYPSYAELTAAVRIRRNIIDAARRSALSFHTSKIERPADFWTYSKERGFTVQPGKPLIEALRKATQPETPGESYSFSCYRATEYVILLGVAQELATCNPGLLQELQRQWESRAIMSRQYHDVFLREYGSMNEPLPPQYYVPGDRLWFRNPDECSSDVPGYEGSWVLYLGGGFFTNFWQCDKPYTITSKCIEMYHWRHGVCRDADSNLQMDEAIVAERVSATMRDPTEVERISSLMMRLRDPQGVYADGGCIDASREYPRWVCPRTSDIILPGA